MPANGHACAVNGPDVGTVITYIRRAISRQPLVDHGSTTLVPSSERKSNLSTGSLSYEIQNGLICERTGLRRLLKNVDN